MVFEVDNLPEHTAETLMQVLMRWSIGWCCSTVKLEIDLVTQELQIAAAGIVASCHRKVVLGFAEVHYGSFVTNSP